MICSISEVCIGEVYDRDELFALSDYFAQGEGVLFGCVPNLACFRAVPDNIHKEKWVIKEYFLNEE